MFGREIAGFQIEDIVFCSTEAAKRYDDLKVELAQSYTEARSNYSEGKAFLIKELLEEAYSWKTQIPDLRPVLSLRSLAYQTDLSILAFQGRLIEREEYIVVESLGNPGYFWGNLLVMKKPPGPGDYQKWTNFFRQEFSHQPLVQHVTFGWDIIDGAEGMIDDFQKYGFIFEPSVVLTLTNDKLQSAKHSVNNLEVRPLQTDEDWQSAIRNQIDCRGETFRLEVFLPFKRAQMKKFRDMSEAGLGHWFGAFLNGHLVADCGLYCIHGVGRYHAVGTHPDFRKKGICGNLIYESAKFGVENLGTNTLVMVADPDYHAANVYKSIGFMPTEKAFGMCRRPK